MPMPTQGPGYTGPGDESRPEDAYKPQPWYTPSTATPANFDAQQSLAIDYGEFDVEVNRDLGKLMSAPGGPSFITRWNATKAEFIGRNGGPGIPARNMTTAELADSRNKLNALRTERDGLIGTVTVPDTGEKWIPDLDTLIKPKPISALPTTTTNVPKPATPVAPVKAGLFGLSRNATIALGVLSAAALGGGIWYATREPKKPGLPPPRK